MTTRTITRKQLVKLARRMFVATGKRRSYVTIGNQKFYLHKRTRKPVVPARPDGAELTYLAYCAENEIPLSGGEIVMGEGLGRLLFDIAYCPICRVRLVLSSATGAVSLCPKCGQHSPPLRVGGKDI